MIKDHLGLRVKRGVLDTRPSAKRKLSVDEDFIKNSINISEGSNVFTVHAQVDGKIIVGGSFTSINGQDAFGIVRLNVDGTVDNSFQIAEPTGQGFASVFDIDQQSDGKIVAVGAITSYRDSLGNNTTISRNILRLHQNGQFDSSFIQTNVDSTIFSVKCLPDDRILIGGEFDQIDGVSINTSAIRLHPNGLHDTSFDSNTEVGKRVATVDVQADGKVIVGGLFRAVDGNVNADYIARIHPNGALDPSLNANAAFNNDVTSVECLPDGRILVAGDFTAVESGGTDYTNEGIVILHENGRVDPSFEFDPVRFAGRALKASRLEDGRFIAVLESYTNSNQVAGSIYNDVVVLHENGAIDPSFDFFTPPSSLFPYVYSVEVSPDNNIYLCGRNLITKNRYLKDVVKIRR